MKSSVWPDEIQSVVLDSSGDILLEDVNEQILELINDGSGDIEVSGRVQSLKAVINGSGTLKLEK